MTAKPTPIQANILRLLADNPEGRLRLPHSSWKKIVDLERVIHRNGFKRNIPLSTGLAMERAGWLERSGDHLVMSEKGKEVLLTLFPEDFEFAPGNKPALTEAQITMALRERYDREQHGWLFFAQVRSFTGTYGHEHYLDGWAMNLWPSRRTAGIAFEIKVYASDLSRELKNPDKRRFALSVSNEYYFVTPAGLTRPEKLPEECGLIEVKCDGAGYRLTTKKKAPYRKVDVPGWWFWASVLRNARQRNSFEERLEEKNEDPGE